MNNDSGCGVTLVSAVRVRAGSADRYSELHDRAASAAARSGNLIRSELVPAVEGSQDDTISLLTFGRREDLDRWVRSHERKLVLQEMARLHDGDRSINVLAGFPGWFGTTSLPKRWRQAVVISIGLIPTSMLTSRVRLELLPRATFVESVCFISLANVVLLTWVVLPWLNRRFRRWLNR